MFIFTFQNRPLQIIAVEVVQQYYVNGAATKMLRCAVIKQKNKKNNKIPGTKR